MKKFLIVAFVCCFASLQNVFACDYCMCSYGVSPVLQNNISIGLDFRYLDFNTIVNGHTVIPNSFNQNETVFSTRLTGIIPLHSLSQNLSAIISFPVVFHNYTAAQTPDAVNEGVGPDASSSGISDMTAFLSYMFWHSMGDEWSFSAAAMVGAKIPTGYTGAKDEYGNLLNTDLEGGTGSLDPMMNLTLLAGAGNWGMSLNLFDWYPTKGAQQYQYGNSFTYEYNAIYHVLPDVFNSPNLYVGAGIGGEWHGVEYQDGVAQDNTGGNSNYIAPSVRLQFDRVTLNARMQYFFLHNVNGEQLDYTYRILAGIQYQL
ncbi:MAG TPA: transporter [Candidatus Kapabacteria bacterium]|nr:transporter [Candidatus Kapabacteria bacterium]